MATSFRLALPARPEARPGPPVGWPVLVPLAGLALAAWLVGAGYTGGGADDWWYVQAARCWAAHGGCVATTHWATRLPLVVPTAAALSLFGESWRAAAIVPLLYAGGCVALLSHLVARWRGPTEGCVAGLVLVATPAFSVAALQPSVDAAELFWLLLAAAGLWRARREEAAWPALWAGAALGLACMTRLTAAAALPFTLVALPPVSPGRWRQLARVAAGGTLVLGMEAMGYWRATGDPFHHLKLALHHTRIPSSALAPSVPLDQSPILNPLFIGGWTRRMGIHVHWSVDGALNLLASPEVGATLLASALLMAAAWMAGVWPRGRGLLVLNGCAVLHAALLVLVLAVDPAPRMVFAELAVAAATIGALAPPLWASGRAPLLVALASAGCLKAAVTFPNLVRVPLYADRAAAFAQPGEVALDEWSGRSFTLEPRWRGVPVRAGPGARDLLAIAPGSCAARRPAGARLVAERRIDRPEDGGRLFAKLVRIGWLDQGQPILACRFARS